MRPPNRRLRMLVRLMPRLYTPMPVADPVMSSPYSISSIGVIGGAGDSPAPRDRYGVVVDSVNVSVFE